ncbi:ParB-like nuclease domain-containing protein [Haloechinothrix alba]|uniref:ParB-like nuclease domain-containing protein n=1 Tax=Haloechinothrix alba TaxID=664784 RepID=A0A238WF41_9PSEU|nr:ParB N-terminal domain-containing protein [Haloechinothrix alba]SNR44299.1 ParB-like nuclease domain-containing protein [Haloechinothrix alba]
MTHDLTTDTAPVAELRAYHRNPRQGDTRAIAESLRVNGQYRPIVVNRGTHTGRANEVLAGNHTLAAARDEGWAEITVCYVDVDDDQAARIVTADNRTADRASYDDRILAELLTDLPDLDGTGYDPGDLDDILARIDDTVIETHQDTDADYAESPEETQARQNATEGETRAERGLREIILVLPNADADEADSLIDQLRPDSDTTRGQVVLDALRAAAGSEA